MCLVYVIIILYLIYYSYNRFLKGNTSNITDEIPEIDDDYDDDYDWVNFKK